MRMALYYFKTHTERFIILNTQIEKLILFNIIYRLEPVSLEKHVNRFIYKNYKFWLYPKRTNKFIPCNTEDNVMRFIYNINIDYLVNLKLVNTVMFDNGFELSTWRHDKKNI